MALNRNYRADHPGTGGLMRSREVASHLEDVARDAQEFAQSISPVQSGEYRDSFITDVTEEHIARERRAVAVLSNTAEHAGAVEAGAHVLSRTVDHIEQTYG